ncbi:unnamed protein product [Caenorhabditis bovis]|uniref:Uncharacterized protein n=1 Tax=Caenorhabditis bovis TaxID=2654633 RepID=A0A8S1EGP9_9PELO|nr:unnamed protein product [Caenorhabditis bovis]
MIDLFTLNPDREMVLIGTCYIVIAFFIFPLYGIVLLIIGCSINSMWIAMFPILAILAISRMRITMNKADPNQMGLGVKIALILALTVIFLIWIFGCIKQNFKFSPPGWSYDMTVEYAKFFSALELVVCIPTLTLSFSAYIIIVLQVYKKRRMASMQRSHRAECRILVQAVIITVYLTLLIVLWYNDDEWFPDSHTTTALLQIAWIAFGYTNPLLLITLNKGLRNQLKATFFRKKSSGNDTHQTRGISKIVMPM